MKRLIIGIIGLAVMIIAGIFGGKYLKKVLAVPVVDTESAVVEMVRNTFNETYYSVTGLRGYTRNGDDVTLRITSGSNSFSSKDGSFSDVPSSPDGTYAVFAVNEKSGESSEEGKLSGFFKVKFEIDSTKVPVLDVSEAAVSCVIGAEKYYYVVKGVKAAVPCGDECRVWLRDPSTQEIYGSSHTSDDAFAFENIPFSETGSYEVYAENVSESNEYKIVSETFSLSGFVKKIPVTRITAAELEKMYREQKVDTRRILGNCVFVFSGVDQSNTLMPNTHREIYIKLRYGFWKDIKVTGVKYNCLGYISKIYFNVVQN